MFWLHRHLLTKEALNSKQSAKYLEPVRPADVRPADDIPFCSIFTYFEYSLYLHDLALIVVCTSTFQFFSFIDVQIQKFPTIGITQLLLVWSLQIPKPPIPPLHFWNTTNGKNSPLLLKKMLNGKLLPNI